MANQNSRLVRIYSSTSAADAHLARNFLEENGIQARISGDALAHAGLLSAGLVEVYTFEEQAAAARDLLLGWSAADSGPESDTDDLGQDDDYRDDVDDDVDNDDDNTSKD